MFKRPAKTNTDFNNAILTDSPCKKPKPLHLGTTLVQRLNPEVLNFPFAFNTLFKAQSMMRFNPCEF